MRTKLFLALSLVALVSVAAVTLIVRQGAVDEVTAYMLRGGMVDISDLTATLEAYYQANGSWEGVESVLSSPGSPGMGWQGGQNGPGMMGGPLRHGVLDQRLRLADAQGQVIADTAGDAQGELSQEVLLQAVPLKSGAQTVGYLLPEGGLTLSSGDEALLLQNLNRAALTAALLAGGLALLLSGMLAYRLLRPVTALTRAAERLASGDLSQRVQVQGSDEIAALGGTFNHMAESLQQAQTSRRAMTADIAHELRNPLAVQRANLEALQDGVYPLTAENLSPVLEQNLLLTRLVEDLKTLALAESGQLKLELIPTDLAGLAARVVERYQPQARPRGIDLSLNTLPAGQPPVTVDPTRIEQILGNLISNALRYTPEGGWIRLSLAPEGERAIRVTVRDSGPGIPEDALVHIFERFYRADKARSRAEGGSGLGLSIARQLAESHQGSLTAANHPEGGAVFTLTLPVGRKV